MSDIEKAIKSVGTFEAFQKTLLFHGTCEEIKGNIRGGGYDGVLWTATTPTVAQNYIPTSGASMSFAIKQGFELNDRVSFHYDGDIELTILAMMGYKIRVDTEEGFQKITGYTVIKDKKYADLPKNKELNDFVINELGYAPDSSGRVDLKLDHKEGKRRLLKADYEMPGTLYVFTGAEKLNLYDYSTGESDLMNVQYHDLEMFKSLEEKGYDGVIIDDFAQSERYGNVGHRSVGLFSEGIKKLGVEPLPAVNYDWGKLDEKHPLSAIETPEFKTKEIYEKTAKKQEVRIEKRQDEEQIQIISKRKI